MDVLSITADADNLARKQVLYYYLDRLGADQNRVASRV